MDNEALVLDFLSWVEDDKRSYRETMDVWRTSCPRLTIWEDAVDLGLVAVRSQLVTVTDNGRAFLNEHRPV